MKRKSALFVFIIVFILALIKVFLTARLATTGAELARIESQRQRLAEQNSFFEEEIVELSTLSRISQEAAKLGFAQATRVVSLTPEVPIALR